MDANAQITDGRVLTGKIKANAQLTQDEHDFLNKSLVNTVIQGQLNAVKLHAGKGADVNYKDKNNISVLEHDIVNLNTRDKEHIVRELVERGANFNNRIRNDQTEFMLLVHCGVISYEYIAEMVDKIDNVYERNLLTWGTFLHMLIGRPDDINGRIVLMKRFLQKGLSLNSKDKNGDTPLHTLAGIACHHSIAFLINNGADPHATNRCGENILHLLAKSNHFDGFSMSLNLVLHNGISINSVDKKGQTALHHALGEKETTRAVVTELVGYGIQTNIKDKRGRNEAYHAVYSIDNTYSDEQVDEREEIIKLLFDTGVNVNEGDLNGVTPLHIAVFTVLGSMLYVIGCMLHKVGANPLARTKSGATPLHWACRSFNQTIVLLHWYKKHGLDVNIVDNFGSSALHWAIWFREISVARLLLQRGIDSSIKDKEGETAAELAKNVHMYTFIELTGDYMTPFYNDLNEKRFICSETDPIFACKQLRFIQKVDDNLADAEYIEHVKLHRKT